MIRIIFTTCGTSVLSSACWKLEKNVNLKTLCGTKGAELRSRLAWNEAQILAFKTKHQSAQQLADTVDTNLLNEENIGRIRDLPAEVASLMALNYLLEHRKKSNPLQATDRIILLHSEDPLGRYCAEVVKYILDTYLQDNKVAKLEAIGDINPDRFGTSMEALSDRCLGIIHECDNSDDNCQFIFNLTGGYKAMGITMSALGTALFNYETKVYYLHETTDYRNISVGSFTHDGIQWKDLDIRDPDCGSILAVEIFNQ